MNSPYMGKFRVTNTQTADHDGLDLVGIDSKEIHATVSGNVVFAGWENPQNQKQGFGQYVCIRGNDDRFYYYGHLSEIKVKYGQAVRCTDVIGIEGHTGYTIPDGPEGSHCHYCCRKAHARGNAFDISAISGIPNALGTYDDGYQMTMSAAKSEAKVIEAILEIDGHKYSGMLSEI